MQAANQSSGFFTLQVSVDPSALPCPARERPTDGHPGSGEMPCLRNATDGRLPSSWVQRSGFGISSAGERHKEALFVWDRSEVQGGFERTELG